MVVWLKTTKEVYYLGVRTSHILAYLRMISDSSTSDGIFLAWGIAASSLHKGCTKGITPPQNFSDIKGPT
jgi:hypothetical protein